MTESIKEAKINEFSNDATMLMAKSYERMIVSQGNFSNIAVSRAIEIAKMQNINLDSSHIIGVSFAPQFAVVAVLYKPVILAPGDDGNPKQVNIPVPVECLFPTNDSWKDIYNKILEDATEAIKKDKEAGKLEEAFGNFENLGPDSVEG
jgi:hypothetical protein